MERRNFLRRLFNIGVGAAALATVPAIAKTTEEETFNIDSMFTRFKGNNDLFYLNKDSWLEEEIKNILGNRFVDKKNFCFYLPLYNCYLPIKDKYTKKDFENFLLVVKSKKFDYFCDNIGTAGVEVGAVRMYRDNREGYYKLEMYQARNPKNCGCY